MKQVRVQEEVREKAAAAVVAPPAADAPKAESLVELGRDIPIVPVTFKDSTDCTQTYDHPRSVGSPPQTVCNSKDGKEVAEAAGVDAQAKPADPRDAKKESSKDARDQKAAAAKEADEADKAKPKPPKSGERKKAPEAAAE